MRIKAPRKEAIAVYKAKEEHLKDIEGRIAIILPKPGNRWEDLDLAKVHRVKGVGYSL